MTPFLPLHRSSGSNRAALCCRLLARRWGIWEAWHQAGMLEQKQNVFDDYIAAAEWLIANSYTRAARLAIRGGSNGGLLWRRACCSGQNSLGRSVRETRDRHATHITNLLLVGSGSMNMAMPKPPGTLCVFVHLLTAAQRHPRGGLSPTLITLPILMIGLSRHTR